MDTLTMVSPSEEFGLGAALNQMEAINAPRNAVLKGAAGIILAARATNTPLADLFGAMAQGAESEGDRLLFETLSISHKYIKSWGILTIFGLGLYQAGKSSVSIVEWLWGLAKKVGGLAAGGAISTVAAATARDDELENLASEALGFLTQILAGKLPVLAALLGLIHQGPPSSEGKHDAGSPLPIDPSNWSRRGEQMDEEVVELN